MPAVLPMTSSAAPAISSATAIMWSCGARSRPSRGRRAGRAAAQGRNSDRDVRGSLAKGAAEGVADDDRDAEALGRGDGPGIGIDREQDERVQLGSVRADPADAQTNPCRVSAITSGRRLRDPHRLAQDDLELAWVAVGGELDGLVGRLDLVQPDDPSLRLRDDLLGDDGRPLLELGGVADQRGEVVSARTSGIPSTGRTVIVTGGRRA